MIFNMSYWHSDTDQILKVYVKIDQKEIKKENNVKSYDMNEDIQNNWTALKNTVLKHSR